MRSGLRVYEVRSPEDHRNVSFRCAAVWSVVVAKVTGAIGYARHQSRSRDALIQEGSTRFKKFVVFTAFALPALTHLSAVAQTCPDNVPHVTGTWTTLPYQMSINPISANLRRAKRILIILDNCKIGIAGASNVRPSFSSRHMADARCAAKTFPP